MAAFSGLAIYMWHPERPALYLVPNQLRDDEIMLNKVLEWEADRGVVWIDARSRANFDKSRVKGAYLLNEMEDFYSLLEPIWSEIQNKSDLPFIVYCSSESCLASRKVAEKLRESVGVSEVYILKGGEKSLTERGLLID
ncbi:MAG: rhodanese-like domain-containing protein [Verrucomicrobiales bacterium]|jgi:rhodanese-related sulfurtransferase|tara:strand:+ start:463 stop:879 length:417 start_codon:yes stop_codon:yes gene_type:complete